MCGRLTLTRSGLEVAAHFGLAEVPELAPRYNAAPGQALAVVRRRRGETSPRLELRTWGLLPHWAGAPRGTARPINARLETAARRPAFRDALRRRRCLVPADGFYEWMGNARRRVPHHLALPERRLFALGGLYETWSVGDGARVESFAVLTTEANARVRALHDRMPLLLDPADYAAWLDPERDAPEVLPALADRLEARRVGFRVNDPRVDEPGCLEDDDLPLLRAGV